MYINIVKENGIMFELTINGEQLNEEQRSIAEKIIHKIKSTYFDELIFVDSSELLEVSPDCECFEINGFQTDVSSMPFVIHNATNDRTHVFIDHKFNAKHIADKHLFEMAIQAFGGVKCDRCQLYYRDVCDVVFSTGIKSTYCDMCAIVVKRQETYSSLHDPYKIAEQQLAETHKGIEEYLARIPRESYVFNSDSELFEHMERIEAENPLPPDPQFKIWRGIKMMKNFD